MKESRTESKSFPRLPYTMYKREIIQSCFPTRVEPTRIVASGGCHTTSSKHSRPGDSRSAALYRSKACAFHIASGGVSPRERRNNLAADAYTGAYAARIITERAGKVPRVRVALDVLRDGNQSIFCVAGSFGGAGRNCERLRYAASLATRSLYERRFSALGPICRRTRSPAAISSVQPVEDVALPASARRRTTRPHCGK